MSHAHIYTHMLVPATATATLALRHPHLVRPADSHMDSFIFLHLQTASPSILQSDVWETLTKPCMALAAWQRPSVGQGLVKSRAGALLWQGIKRKPATGVCCASTTEVNRDQRHGVQWPVQGLGLPSNPALYPPVTLTVWVNSDSQLSPRVTGRKSKLSQILATAKVMKTDHTAGKNTHQLSNSQRTQ